MEEFTAWIVSQPLGLGVLLGLTFGFVFEYIVSGRQYRRVLAANEKLEEANERLEKAVQRLADGHELVVKLVEAAQGERRGR